MSFEINPKEYDGGEGGGSGSRRPDVREGKKLVWLVGLAYGTSKAGNQKIDCCFVVVGDPDEETDVGGLIWDTFTMTQAASWKLQQIGAALGQKASWDASNKAETYEVFTQAPVWAEVSLKPKYNAEGMRAVIDRYSLFGEEPTESQDKTANDAEKWYLDWSSKKYGSNTAKSDDDIPF